MQRAFDQVIHDVAIQKLPVVFCLDRAGIAGADGPTHHGAYDIAFFRCIPNMIVSAPMNEEELRNLMYTAQLKNHGGPFSIRYPRGNGVMPDWKRPFKEIEVGKGRKVCDGEDVAILTIGHIGNETVKACLEINAEGYHPAHYDLRFVKPIDERLLHEVFTKFGKVITVEDGCIQGGFGTAVLEFAADHNYKADIKRLGMPDLVIEHGEQSELWEECGYNASSIIKEVKRMVMARPTQSLVG
jgi:1-deoxy-D-xylulose-5-phosphate synthase